MYNKYNPVNFAKLSANYLTQMTDDKNHNLPYWIVDLSNNPVYAKHCRADDGELTSSWAEALLLISTMVEDKNIRKVCDNLIDLVFKGFHDDGLHYNLQYPWASDIFASFHEQAYVASFLTTLYKINKLSFAKDALDNLIETLLKLVIRKKTVTYWKNTYPNPRKSYYFIGDAIYDKIGFDLSKTRGGGEEAIRNHMIIGPLSAYFEETKSEKALDLAEGLINYSVLESKYFLYNGEFNGHVHSYLWIATGLARIARLTSNYQYTSIARNIYLYGLKISSSFGFVPHLSKLTHETHITCESCCIKDMIELALEMIKLGYDEWDVIDRFARNQLVENQIVNSEFITVNNDIADTELETYKLLNNRIIGGFTGNAEPNSIPLSNERFIAGCCSGIAPQAHYLVWSNIISIKRNNIYINLLIDYNDFNVSINCEYPNEGKVSIVLRKDYNVKIRIPQWVGNRFSIFINDVQIPAMWEYNYIVINNLKANDTIIIINELVNRNTLEKVAGTEYHITWRGNDVIQMFPEGKPQRLYIRDPNYITGYLYNK